MMHDLKQFYDVKRELTAVFDIDLKHVIRLYLDLFQSLYDFFAEIRNYSIFFWLSLSVHSMSLKRIDYPKQLSGPPFLLNVSTALKGTHNYIFICCHCSWCCAVWHP